MNPNIQRMLQGALAAINSGNTRLARQTLDKVLRREPLDRIRPVSVLPAMACFAPRPTSC